MKGSTKHNGFFSFFFFSKREELISKEQELIEKTEDFKYNYDSHRDWGQIMTLEKILNKHLHLDTSERNLKNQG